MAPVYWNTAIPDSRVKSSDSNIIVFTIQTNFSQTILYFEGCLLYSSSSDFIPHGDSPYIRYCIHPASASIQDVVF